MPRSVRAWSQETHPEIRAKALPFFELLRRSPDMTHRRRTGPSAKNDEVLAAFNAEVASLMSLSREAFAAVDPDVLVPLVVTIRVSPSEVSPS